MAKVKLSYFDFPGGRGEDCRIALHMAGIEFDDDRIAPPTWPDRKAEFPFSVVPVMEIEGKGQLADSNAILRFVGSQHDLHPVDAFEAARHEAVMHTVEYMRAKVTPTLRMKDPEAKKAAREELATGYLKTFGKEMEKQIQGPFLSGDNLQVADIKLYSAVGWFAKGVVDHVPAEVFDEFPKLKGLYNAVKEHDGVKSWYAKPSE